MNIRHLLLSGALGIAAAFPAFGRVIVDTGTPSGVCPSCAVSLDSSQWVAGKFTISKPVTIAYAQGFFGPVGQTGHYFTLALLSDIGGAPGAVLDSTQAYVKTGVNWNGSDTLNWSLPSGGSYWLAFEALPTDSFTQGVMPVGAPRRLRMVDFTDNGVWTPEGKLSIGVRILRPPDKMKKALEAYIPSRAAIGGGANSVPEPGAWALMVVGLGLLGAAVRGRRSAAAAV